ncbi:MAG: UbiD family decarboxylase, partial [Gemmataceae bacterium]|nr:UbiD family decarboxylase [Gemmataceae bacterium]
GMYRVQMLGPRHMAMHWHMHHDGARHWRSWKKLGRPMPVAVVLGGESVLPYAATAPLPPGISELLMAGFLNRGGIRMVRAKTVPLWVPANAEIVIEGYVRHDAGFIGWDPRGVGRQSVPTSSDIGQDRVGTECRPTQEVGTEYRPTPGPGAVFEGPFGDHTGFYSMPDRYPIMDVTAITMRKDAIYPTTVVGLPPQEDYFLGKATERIFFPLLKTLIHDIEDYDLPLFGAFHNCAVMKIKKAYPLQGRRVMHSVWGAGQMAWTKTLFVVDDDVDVHDIRAVLRAAAANCHPRRDIETVNGPLDILDHAAPRLGAGMKIGFDCTRKIAGEEVGGIAVASGPGQQSEPARAHGCSPAILGDARLAPQGLDAVDHEGWLFVKIDKQRAGDGLRAIMHLQGLARKWDKDSPSFVVILAGEVDAKDLDSAFFHWCAHTDVSRDSTGWITPSGRYVVAFDATPKLPGDERNGQPVRPWPPVLKTDPAVARRVQERWGELS